MSQERTVFDLIVVGAGISAGPLIEQILKNLPEAKVLIVDRSPTKPRSEAAAQNPEVTLVDSEKSTITLPQRWTTQRLGGASHLWYGQLSRFTRSDFISHSFSEGSGVPESSTAWPIGYEDLEPYYAEIERKLMPFSADKLLGVIESECKFVTDRFVLSQFEREAYDVLSSAQWMPYSGATCLGGKGWNENPVDPLTLKPIDLATPALHSRNWFYRTLENIGSSKNCVLDENVAVKKIDVKNGICKITGLRSNGRSVEYEGLKAVLACGVVETTKILSRSDNIDRNLLGKNFTFSTEVSAYISTNIARELSDQNDTIGRFANISTKALYIPDDPGLVKGGKVSVYDALNFEGESYHKHKIAKLSGNSDIDAISPKEKITLKFSFKGESIPYSGKHILFDTGENLSIAYKPHSHDQHLVKFVKQQIVELASLFPEGKIIGCSDNVFGLDHISTHLHGGACAGTDPSTSVLSPECEVWSLPGIYVADASFMPSSGATNSSLTIMANSLRVADIVMRKLKSKA